MSLRELIASRWHHLRITHVDDEWATTSKRLHDLLDVAFVPPGQSQYAHSRGGNCSAEFVANPVQVEGCSSAPPESLTHEQTSHDRAGQPHTTNDTDYLRQALREYRESSWDDSEFADLSPECDMTSYDGLRRSRIRRLSGTKLESPTRTSSTNSGG